MNENNSEKATDKDFARTRASVKVGDAVARVLITFGGIGTIISVSTVFLFLLWVVFPLFMPPATEPIQQEGSPLSEKPVEVKVDHQKLLTFAVYPDGRLSVRRLDTGEEINELQIAEDRKLTCSSFAVDGDGVAFGFDDGSVQLGKISVSTTYPSNEDFLAEHEPLKAGGDAVWKGGIVTLTPQGQYRLEKVDVELEDIIENAHDSAVLLIDNVELTDGSVYAAVTQKGDLFLEKVIRRENWMTGEITLKRNEVRIPYDADGRGIPEYVCINGLGDNVFVIWKDGVLQRYDVRDFDNPQLVETVDLESDGGAEITSVGMLTGRSTIVAGDSAGNISAWFKVRPDEGTDTPDGAKLVEAHILRGGTDDVIAIANSERSRIIAALYRDATVRLYQVTSNHLIASGRLPLDKKSLGFGTLALAPKDDGLVVYTDEGLFRWDFNLRHPEATLSALFLPVWYEGYEKPEDVWQSTGGTDDFEPKLGLYPLVFGTVKATVYTMLIAVPLAIFAAIYTSEFLHPKVRSKVKPGIELMASLPSVVLGFLAALVIAPFIEEIVPATLASFITLPMVFLVAAYIWQLLPESFTLRFSRWRLLICVLLAPVGIAAAFPVGHLLESLLFEGDLKRWLDGQTGIATSGWFVMLLPLCAILVLLLFGRTVNPLLETIGRTRGGSAWAAADLVKFVVGLGLTALLAWTLGGVLALFGMDPRSGLVGTYVQRNAMIVGFVMGFAVIPIIYTIADDALNTVPDHLRSASLAAGATPWQTTVRIIVPTAMSGLFSAMMVGLGRAVGETMIVLMATGNTPLMEWNPFNGFRTLSANIAVELPEAVRDSTHYRTLFLAALLLFVMTFIVNTAAEVVRLRFRKRAYQL